MNHVTGQRPSQRPWKETWFRAGCRPNASYPETGFWERKTRFWTTISPPKLLSIIICLSKPQMADSVSQDQQLADGDEEGFLERYCKTLPRVRFRSLSPFIKPVPLSSVVRRRYPAR